MDKHMERNIGKNLHTGHGARPQSHNNPHGQQKNKKQKKKKKNKKRPLPTPEAEVAKKRAVTASSRLGDLRLILDSTSTDEELALKVKNATVELQAVVEALGDEGPSYLGIVDKVRLSTEASAKMLTAALGIAFKATTRNGGSIGCALCGQEIGR